MIHPVSRLIREGEHQQLDFKFEIADAPKIARTLVAFANTDGGRLLIGVRDDGTIAGVRSEEEYFMAGKAAKHFCRPPVQISVKEWTLNKKTILEVIVLKSMNRPHYAKDHNGQWIAYTRINDQNFVANRILLNVWKKMDRSQGVFLTFTDPERFLLQSLEKTPTITLEEFARSAGISDNKTEQILVRFILLRMIRMHFSENHTYFTLSDQVENRSESLSTRPL